MEKNKKKALLLFLPYWDPMIPPNGIAHLKTYVEKFGHEVKTIDIHFEEDFQKIYHEYFDSIKSFVPEEQWGNFYNIGHDVMQDHMMAHINHTDEEAYVELVKMLVYNTFYFRISDSQAKKLNCILDDFYTLLEKCYTEILAREKPDVIGATAYKCTVPASLFVFQLTKKINPNIKTVMGGNNFVDMHAIGTPSYDNLLEYSKSFLDNIIISPQGEILFLKYLNGELPEDKRVYTKEDINSEIVAFPEMQLPDFSDFDTEKYPCLPATGSSSCPFECSFCSSKAFYGKHRVKDVAQTVDEMVALQKTYGHQLFFMSDSLVNTYVMDFARELVSREESVYFDGYLRVDENSASIENTLLWRKAGYYRARMGAESASPKVLSLMGKDITPDQIRATVSALAHAGIKTTTYWAIGHPGETEEDFQMTLDMVEELKDDIFQAETNPFLYYFSTQAKSDDWAKDRRHMFPEWARKMLVFESWTLEIEPKREEVFNRMFRFEEHCKKIGIPNPYNIKDYIEADKRWQRLHKNAAPPIIDFLSRKNYINENKNIKEVSFTKKNRDSNLVFNI